jgi:hypothetical protein
MPHRWPGSSAPTTLLSFIVATTEKLIVSTSTTLITTNDPVPGRPCCPPTPG